MGVGPGSAAVIGRPAIAPSAPTNLVVTPSDASLSVSFTAGASNGEEILNYEYSINDGATWVAASPSVVASPVVIRGLTNGTTYAVKLRAVNDVGSGASSAGVSGRPVAVPSAATNVVVTRGDKSLSVSFTPAAPNGEVVTNYDYSINDGATWVAVSPSVTSGPIVISGLTNGTRYPVKVRAENAVGKGAASIAVTGRPAIAPAAPTNLVVFRNDASLAIAFTAGADNGEEFTRYEYSIDNGATWKSIRGSDVQSPIRITGLTNGTLYSVSLRAVNDVGPGAISGVVTGTPNAPILSGSAGKNVRIINEPVTTFAANSDIAINGAKVSIGMVPPTVKTNDPITYYQYTLRPTKKGSPVITKLFKAKPGAATSGVLTGKPKTSYTVLVTSVTATGKKKSWVGPPITTG
jgi:titin